MLLLEAFLNRITALRAVREPSTLVTALLLAWTARYVHDLTGTPSTSKAHALQLEVSHPTCVPVSPSFSRRR